LASDIVALAAQEKDSVLELNHRKTLNWNNTLTHKLRLRSKQLKFPCFWWFALLFALYKCFVIYIENVKNKFKIKNYYT